MQSPSPFRSRARGLFLLALGFLFVTVRAQVPPPQTNVVRRIVGATLPPVVFTNLELSWDRYTNGYFEVLGSTNLAGTNWYHFTNAPLWTTNLIFPRSKPAEFFKVQVVIIP